MDKPKTEKHNEDGTGPSGSGLSFGLSSMQGWRMEMEDAHAAVTDFQRPELKDWSFFAVFDGHAGGKVSEQCAERLLESILSFSESNNKPLVNDDENEVQDCIREGFLLLDEELKNIPEIQRGEDKSGTTVVCALISPKHVYIGNCGDSRAVLAKAGEVALQSQDHKPILPRETQRIQEAGGSVMVQRVNGALAVSRALGDFVYKQVRDKGPTEQLVSPEPEVTVHQRSDKDEFLILACDGIWDVMSNADVCDFIRSRLKVQSKLTDVANEVVDTCLFKGSQDNMSIVIIKFQGSPSVDPQEVERDAKLDEWVRQQTEEICENCVKSGEDYSVDLIRRDLANKDLPSELGGFPPGGGAYAKQHIIESIWKERHPEKETPSEK